MTQLGSGMELNQPGLPFTLDDRLAIRAAALAKRFCALEVNIAMNHPAYFEAVEVFVRGRSDVACVIWRSVNGILMEDMVGNLSTSALGSTMSEVFESLANLAGELSDDPDWTYDQPFMPRRQLH